MKKMNKHAYLIMAHNNFEILEKQLKILDSNYNDIYLHIDKKVKNFDFHKFNSIVKKSKLIFTKRIDVRWTGFSQIQCELLLFDSAYNNKFDQKYSYYHVMSGVDFPLKQNIEIYNFFEKNIGKEFIHYSGLEKKNKIVNRINKYHFFPGYIRYKNRYKRKLASLTNCISLKIQTKFKVDRLKKKNINIKFGANWCSITSDLVAYILKNKKTIYKYFKFSNCADELFVQTLVYNSPFKNNLYHQKYDNNYKSIMREIDWERGSPYTFSINDYDQLKKSKMLFARKFDSSDIEIINKLYNDLKIKNK